MMRVLFLDLNREYMSPPPVCYRLLFAEATRTDFFGPGFVDAATLAKGVLSFVADRSYDFVVAGHKVLQSYEDDCSHIFAKRLNLRVEMAKLGEFYRTCQISRLFIHDMDWYQVCPKFLEELRKLEVRVITNAGFDFLKSCDSPPSVGNQHDRFVNRATDNFRAFLREDRGREIPIPFFVLPHEIRWHPASDRPWDVAIEGTSYLYRAAALRAVQRYKEIKLNRSSRFKRLLLSVCLSKGRSRWSILMFNSMFAHRLEDAKVSFTCGSTLDYPVRKFFEIPARGAALVCVPFCGFERLGFRHNLNCLTIKPEDTGVAVKELLQNSTQLDRIAAAGRDLVREHHSLGCRVQQLRGVLAALRDGKYRGARWEEGKFILE